MVTKPPADPRHDKLVRELKSLRRGTGLDDERLKACPILLGLAAVELHAANSWPEARLTTTTLAAAAKDLLTELLNGLGPREWFEALRHAYALAGPELGGTLERRGQYADLTKQSPSTVARQENRAIRLLADRLLQLESVGVKAVQHRQYPHRPAMVAPDSTMDSEIVYRFRNGRVPHEWLETHIITAREHGVQKFRFFFFDLANVPSVVHVIMGGELVSVERQPTGAYMGVIRYPKPLRKGQSHTIRFVRRIDPSSDEPPPVVGWGHVAEVNRFRLKVEFAPDALPVNAESFVSWLVVPEHPITPPAPAHLQPGNYIAQEWYNLDPTKTYCLRWQWQ